MKRGLAAFVMILALTLVLTGCQGGSLRPEALEDRVLPHLETALNGIRAGDWQLAGDSLWEAELAWRKVKPMLSLVSTMNDMERLEESMTRARAAIEARAHANAFEEVAHSISVLDNVVNW